jgi:hypothetical protein
VTERWLQKADVFGVGWETMVYEIELLLLLCLELQRRLDPISLDWFIYPPLSLATSGFQ